MQPSNLARVVGSSEKHAPLHKRQLTQCHSQNSPLYFPHANPQILSELWALLRARLHLLRDNLHGAATKLLQRISTVQTLESHPSHRDLLSARHHSYRDELRTVSREIFHSVLSGRPSSRRPPYLRDPPRQEGYSPPHPPDWAGSR